jgi:hypothetical protein
MITFITAPKPFRGQIELIQRNAIASWLAAVPSAQVILFGDETGTAAAAADLGVDHEPTVHRSPAGTPLLDDIFRAAHDRARHPILGFVNADIVFRGDVAALRHVPAPFLVVGRSTDVDSLVPLPFDDPDWRSRLAGPGRSRGPFALDFFFFNHGLFADIPPFAIGRARFDNWLVWKALQAGAAVVDGSAVLDPAHQRHGYGHLAGGREEAYRGADARRNQALAGWWCYLHLHSVFDAQWTLTADGLRPRSRRFGFLRQLLARASGRCLQAIC